MDTLSRLRGGELHGVTRLDLSCGLETFPEEIFDLSDTLEVLNLSGNELTTLPDELPRLHRLKVIFCSDNPFTAVPEVLGRCENLEMVGFKANRISHLPAASLPPKLRWLILTDNRLASLPDELGRCEHLQKLMLAGNRLSRLPESLAACRNLELLRISANQLEALPEWLFGLPKLAWLAFAGNPLAASREADALARQATPHIAWHALDVQQVLGEGASGVIHKADWQHAPDGASPVAVKLFKGAVTSDGWPKSEKAASLAAGQHPNLLAATARIGGHPEGRAGLVMPLVETGFKTLAGPPSLDSCTRDVYPPQTRFTLAVALGMATGIARAAEYLHQRGIQHGDLYAHNMQWNGRGECLLGDFGAASFIADEGHAEALQRIEVRAYACLLEELLERCEPQAAPQQLATREALWELQRRCGQPEVAARPLFAGIRQALEALRA